MKIVFRLLGVFLTQTVVLCLDFYASFQVNNLLHRFVCNSQLLMNHLCKCGVQHIFLLLAVLWLKMPSLPSCPSLNFLLGNSTSHCLSSHLLYKRALSWNSVTCLSEQYCHTRREPRTAWNPSAAEWWNRKQHEISRPTKRWHVSQKNWSFS